VSGDAKLVALRVAQRGPPDVPFVLVVHDGGAEPHESFDFCGPIVSLEFEAEAETVAVASSPSVYLFDRETGFRLDGLQRVRISANHAGSRVGRPPLVVQPCTVTPVA
jgi:hypothetical protein